MADEWPDSDAVLAILRQFTRRRIPNDSIRPGLQEVEFDSLERELDIVFPDDLRYLLSVGLPTGKPFPDWRNGPKEHLREWIAAPREGALFDVRVNQFWADGWGEKPSDALEALTVARTQLAQVPRLLPIFTHRYIPAEDREPGYPVFSIVQTDVIHYGENLWDYLDREGRALKYRPPVEAPARRVPFWSDLALNCDI